MAAYTVAIKFLEFFFWGGGGGGVVENRLGTDSINDVRVRDSQTQLAWLATSLVCYNMKYLCMVNNGDSCIGWEGNLLPVD